MSVIAKISVGNIFFYEVNGVPTHSAPKGSVAIIKNGLVSSTYINNDGGTTWLKTIKPAYGEMFISDVSTIKNWNDYTLGSFYSFDSDNTWTSNVFEEFIKGTDVTFGDYIEYTGSSRIRATIKSRTTTRGGSTRWLQFEHTPAYNFTIPESSVNGFHTASGEGTSGIGGVYVQEMVTNDKITMAFSPVARQGGGPPTGRQFINRHAQIGVYKIDEVLEEEIFYEDWESSGFTENSWTLVNDSQNIWVVGQADSNGGTSSAYISNDGGTSQTYNINVSQISHFYKDFTIPSGTIGLTFDWKCQGENAAVATQYDYGTVVITDTSTTPVAGTEVSTIQATGGGNGRLGADTNLGKFNLNYGTSPGTTWNTESIDISPYAGTTKRFVFTWVNDGSVGANPPFSVDNIKFNSFYW